MNFTIPAPNCSDGQLQLGSATYGFMSIGSYYYGQGRVEVCINGTFGAICDVGWDEVDAQVTCHNLGFSGEHS